MITAVTGSFCQPSARVDPMFITGTREIHQWKHTPPGARLLGSACPRLVLACGAEGPRAPTRVRSVYRFKREKKTDKDGYRKIGITGGTSSSAIDELQTREMMRCQRSLPYVGTGRPNRDKNLSLLLRRSRRDCLIPAAIAPRAASAAGPICISTSACETTPTRALQKSDRSESQLTSTT